MLPAVFVDVRFEARGQARPFAVIGIVAPSARRTGRTAATGVDRPKGGRYGPRTRGRYRHNEDMP
jgi:hypothetical protein